MKKQLTTITSPAIPLDRENVDTDQIIPARFLKAITREGFGQGLFRDWRYSDGDIPNDDFVFNDPGYGGEILIAGHNFGCGSSREHAAWALADFGFTAVVSSFFGDIFKNNALNNSLLPVQVSPKFLRTLFDLVQADPSVIIEIDIPAQTISVPAHSLVEPFDLDPYKKVCLINGYDDIDYLVSMKSQTEAFEKKRKDDYSSHE
jgi:3-isopropylmalate/(R)-2-methylmalate dehydratase small subunit